MSETRQLTKTICVLASTLQQAEDALDAKHAQWQEAVRLGAAERDRRQTLESRLRDFVAEIGRRAMPVHVEELRSILAGEDPDPSLPYPGTSESDWRDAVSLLAGALIERGWEPKDKYSSLTEEIRDARSFIGGLQAAEQPQKLNVVTNDEAKE